MRDAGRSIHCLAALAVAAAWACAGDASWSVSEAKSVRAHAARVAAGKADPNAKLGRDMPALFVAVSSRECAAADTLLSHGADSAAIWQGWTALQLACHPPGGCADVLLRHGAEPDKRVRGATPLMLAVYASEAGTARDLLAHGARVGLAYKGEFPIQEAATRGDPDTVRVLLAGGADPNTPDARGANPLHLAVRAGHDEAAVLLLEAGSRLTEIPADPWTTARTYEWAARHSDQQGKLDQAARQRAIACEYFPAAVEQLEGDRDAAEEDVELASERTEVCKERAGERGLSPPPWSPVRRPSPL
ncbi:MAG: ankyrin repeat domain-containing protein [Myxococcota bacterium]